MTYCNSTDEKMGEKVQFSDIIWTNNDRKKNVFWSLKRIVLFINYIGEKKIICKESEEQYPISNISLGP